MDLGTLCGIISVVTLPATVAIGVMSLGSPSDYFIAKACFLLTGILATGAVFLIQWDEGLVATPIRILANGVVGSILFILMTFALSWVESKQMKPVAGAPVSAVRPGAEGGKGGSGEIFGDGTVIGGAGGRVGAGGEGRGGDGGGGVIHGSGIVIGGQGGSVDGTAIWYPPAESGFRAVMGGQEPDYGTMLPGQGGMSPGYLERFNIVSEIRGKYFRDHGLQGKLSSNKLADVPLDFVNNELQKAGHAWRAKVEGRWYLFYIPSP